MLKRSMTRDEKWQRLKLQDSGSKSNDNVRRKPRYNQEKEALEVESKRLQFFKANHEYLLTYHQIDHGVSREIIA
jgi:hypothetical protein